MLKNLKAKKCTAHAPYHVTCAVRKGLKTTTYLESPTPTFLFTSQFLCGTMTIKDSLLVKISYRFLVEKFVLFEPNFPLFGVVLIAS